MSYKSYLRPTAVGKLRSGDMVACEGRQLAAWGIETPTQAHLWAMCHFEILEVTHCFWGEERTTSLRLRTRSKLVAGERQRGWLELRLQELDPSTVVDMFKPSPRPRRRTSPSLSASAGTLTSV